MSVKAEKALVVTATALWLALAFQVFVDFSIFFTTIAFGYKEVNYLTAGVSAMLRLVGYFGAWKYLIRSNGVSNKLRAILFVSVFMLGLLDPFSRLANSPYVVPTLFHVSLTASTMILLSFAYLINRRRLSMPENV